MIFLYVFLGLVFLLLVYLAAASVFVHRLTAGRDDKYRDFNYNPATSEADFSLPGNSPFRLMSRESNIWWNKQLLERYEITSHDGLHLVGHFLRAEKATRRVALVIHGHQSCSGEMGFIAKMFLEMGFHVFMPDQRAHGKSEGRFYGMGVLERYDMIRWLGVINEIFDSDCEIVMHGSSMGAATVMLTAAERDMADNVVCAIEECGFTRIDAAIASVLAGSYGFMPFKKLVIQIASTLTKLRAGYSFDQTNCVEAASRARIPMMFIHSTADQTVPLSMLTQLYDAHPGEKDMLIIEGAKHAVGYFSDSHKFTCAVKKFVEKYFTLD